MLDYLKKFANAEKNFSLEKLKKSASNYDKLNKLSTKTTARNDFAEPKIVDDFSPLPRDVPHERQSQDEDQEILEKTSVKKVDLSKPPGSDKKACDLPKKKFGSQLNHQSDSNFYKSRGSYWEFVIVMSHDKRLHWLTQPMNWIKISGEILLYENNFKVLARKFVICNFAVETPFIPRVEIEVSHSPPSIEVTPSIKRGKHHEYHDVTLANRHPTLSNDHHFWIDTSFSYNFRVSEENLQNFNLILFIIPNPVVLDVHKDDFNNGWKLMTVIVPSLQLGVQNICHYVHEVPFPDKLYNRKGFCQPWWSYHFQILWECSTRKRSFAVWNAILEFDNPFEQGHRDGLCAKVLISSASFHSERTSNPRFIPRPSFCNDESFLDGTSPTTVRDIFLPKSIRCTGPCTVQVPSFSYFVALPRANETFI